MKWIVVWLSILTWQCSTQSAPIPGAHQWDKYQNFLIGKKIGIVANSTSKVENMHLVDFLYSKGVNIQYIFAPEHGFRGDKDPGAHFSDTVDLATGIPIVGLFGKNKQPTAEQMKNLDVLIFDIQDVGVRFYTYISTMHYVMNACAMYNKPLIVLDRPNPLGDQIDGPVLKADFKSFVGIHPIPVVHGLTVGELALMINGEMWLDNKEKVDLTVIPVANYTHNTQYELPVKPSPNLPNYLSIRLYPSLCFFEASKFSIGRGTDFPFQAIGYPEKKQFGSFTFTPEDRPGMMMNPPAEGQICFGIDLRNADPTEKFTLKYLLDMRTKCGDSIPLISNEKWFNLLAGNDLLLKQIKQGLSEDEIRQSWQPELDAYKKMRIKYLIYKD